MTAHSSTALILQPAESHDALRDIQVKIVRAIHEYVCSVLFMDFIWHKNKDLKGEIEFWPCFCCDRFQIHCVTQRWNMSQGKRTWAPKRGGSWRGRWKRFWKRRRRGLERKERWWQWKLLEQQQASKPLITSPGETCAHAEQRNV